MTPAAVLGSAAPWRVRELEQLDRAIRVRHPLAVRVGVVGVDRSVGASVAAGLTASVLATHGHRVLAVNSSLPGPSLLWRIGQPSLAPVPPEADEVRATAPTFADAVSGVPRAASGAYCLELADSRESRWRHAVAPISRFFDYTVTDWGARDRTGLDTVARTSTILCIVAPADRSSVQAAVDAAGAVRDTPATPLVVVSDPRRAWSPAWQEICRLLPYPGVHLAHDAAHGEERARRLSRATRLSGLRLAAAVVGAASPTPRTEGTPR